MRLTLQLTAVAFLSFLHSWPSREPFVQRSRKANSPVANPTTPPRARRVRFPSMPGGSVSARLPATSTWCAPLGLDAVDRATLVLGRDVTWEILPGVGLSIGAHNLLNTFPDKHSNQANIGSRGFHFSRRVTQFGTKWRVLLRTAQSEPDGEIVENRSKNAREAAIHALTRRENRNFLRQLYRTPL